MSDLLFYIEEHLRRTRPNYSPFRKTYKGLGEPWSLELLLKEVAKHKSRAEFARDSPGAYNAFIKLHPETLSGIFPKREKAKKLTLADVVEEAKKYDRRVDFQNGSMRHYNEALRLGIMNSLGFGPPRGGFNRTIPGSFYLAELKLNNGSCGVVLGITGREVSKRFLKYEKAVMWNRLAFRFDVGQTALDIEKEMKRRLATYAVKEGLSPLCGKPGTDGEIVTGITMCEVIDMLRECYPNLPKPESW